MVEHDGELCVKVTGWMPVYFFLEMCVLMLKVTPSLQSTYIGKHSMNGYALDESYTRDHIK